ncbi:hypothetical protein D3C72_1668480 [compost metagenome]
MAGLASHRRHKTGKHALLELQHVGGRQIIGDQHHGRVAAAFHPILLVFASIANRCTGRRLYRAGDAPHMAQHPLHHLLQVAFALAQVLVIHFVKLAAQQFQLCGQRPFGVVQAFGDQLAHAQREHVVLHQHEVHIQQGCQLLRRVHP